MLPLESETISFVDGYYKPNLDEGLRAVDDGKIEHIVDVLERVIKDGANIFAFGNGGSEAIAEQFILAIEQNAPQGFRFGAYSNPKVASMVDWPIDTVFNATIRRKAKPGDLVFLFSSSGNSNNVVAAADLCKEMGLETIGVCGDGTLKDLCSYALVFEEDDQQIREDQQLATVQRIAKVLFNRDRSETLLEEQLTVLRKIAAIQVFDTATRIHETFRSTDRRLGLYAPDSGAVGISTGHMAHNYKWDSFQGVNERNGLVMQGVSSYHHTGVSNDGGDGLNIALEATDVLRSNKDLAIIFARSSANKRTQKIVAALKKAKVPFVSLFFEEDDHQIAGFLTQATGHLIARVLNVNLRLDEGKLKPQDVQTALRSELALLPYRAQNSVNLENLCQ